MPSSPLRPTTALILQGRITSVDAARWLCTVFCSVVKREYREVVIPSLYSTSSGEGVHYMPEVGAQVFIVTPSDGSNPFLLLSAPQATAATEDGQPGSFHSGRPFLSPGDMSLLTRDGNGFIARRGGLTEIRGTPLARILFNPFSNEVTTIAENWKVDTVGGSIEWRSNDPNTGLLGDTTSLYTSEFREFVTSPSWSVRCNFGNTEERLWFDVEPPAPPLIDTPTTLHVAGAVGFEPVSFVVKQPATLDPAAVVARIQVSLDERAEEVVPSIDLKASRAGDIKLSLTGKLQVTKGADTIPEPAILGRSFLERLQVSLTEVQAAITTLSAATATPVVLSETSALVADITASLSSGSPLLSSSFEMD